MIAYWVSIILIGIIQVIILPITFLPDVSFPTQLTTSISTAGGYIHIFSIILPTTVPTVFSIFTAFIGIEVGIFTFKLVKWVYSKIPGIN